MKQSTICLLALLCLLSLPSFTPSASANQATELFQLRLDKAVPAADGYVVRGVTAEYAIDLDGELLSSNPDRLSFPLPDGTRFEVVRKHLLHESAENFTWYGEVVTAGNAKAAAHATRQGATHAGPLAPGYAMLTWIEGRVLGVLQTPEFEHYHVMPGAGGSHRLLLAAPTAGHRCALETAADSATRRQPPSLQASPLEASSWGPSTLGPSTWRPSALPSRLDTPASTVAPPLDQPAQSPDKSTCTPPTQLHRIDVLGLYGTELEQDLQPTLDFFVSAINQANIVYQNSNISVRFHLIDTAPLDAVYGGEAVQAVDWMFDDPQVLRDLRDLHGADIVALMLPENDDDEDPCGAAVLPIRKLTGKRLVTYRDTDTDFLDRAYVAFARYCGMQDFTLAHEMGHNFGMQHEREDPDATMTSGGFAPITPYAYGYRFGQNSTVPDTRGTTLMGCDRDGNLDSGDCHRVPYFSNPNLSHGTESLGEPLTASNGGSFNACVANQRVAQYAGFRNFDGNSVPRVEITAPVPGFEVDALPLTLSATANDAEDGNLSGQVVWTSNRETLKRAGTNNPAMGASVPVDFAVPGQHLITARVTDSGGKFNERTILVQVNEVLPRLWVDNPTHLEQVSGSTPVIGWALDDKVGEQLSFKVDNQPVTLSNFQRGEREDACSGNPDLGDPDCSVFADKLVGFSGFLDTTTLSNGNRTLEATVTDSAGNQRSFQRTVTVLNPETFTAVADAWTNQQYPNNNYGSSTALYTRNFNSGQARYTYLKFNLGLDQTPTSVKLRLFTLAQWVTQARIYRLATTNWNEYGITWNNGPQDSLGGFALPTLPPNSWVEIDITSLVSSSGFYTFGLLAADQPGIGFYSRETNFKPEIVATY